MNLNKIKDEASHPLTDDFFTWARRPLMDLLRQILLYRAKEVTF